jgi:hypothetical protein
VDLEDREEDGMAMKLGDRFICMEWGFVASERGLNLDAARAEFLKLMETTLVDKSKVEQKERES